MELKLSDYRTSGPQKPFSKVLTCGVSRSPTTKQQLLMKAKMVFVFQELEWTRKKFLLLKIPSIKTAWCSEQQVLHVKTLHSHNTHTENEMVHHIWE